jgi:hypothetical protein
VVAGAAGGDDSAGAFVSAGAVVAAGGATSVEGAAGGVIVSVTGGVLGGTTVLLPELK